MAEARSPSDGNNELGALLMFNLLNLQAMCGNRLIPA
jgi:hypothetical protein